MTAVSGVYPYCIWIIVNDSLLTLSWKGWNVSWNTKLCCMICMMRNMLYQCLWYECKWMHMRAEELSLLRIDESRKQRILTAAEKVNLWLLQGKTRILIAEDETPLWTTAVEIRGFGLCTNLLGILVLRRSSLENIWLSGEALRMSLHSAWRDAKSSIVERS